MAKSENIPELEGWTSLPDSADMLGISRQRIHQLVDAGQFSTAARIGSFVILRTAEVEERKRSQAEAAAAKEARGREEVPS